MTIILGFISFYFFYMINKCALVRKTCHWVMERAKHVTINYQHLQTLADQFHYKHFNEDVFHQTKEDPEEALLQIFMLDSMNFCFWPTEKFQYADLATHVQQIVQEGITLKELSEISEQSLVNRIFHGVHIGLADERAKILRQMSSVVLHKFEGSFVKLIQGANKSAVQLLNIFTENFPNFQDHSVYQGHQVHFYKRGQILIGDIFKKFNGQTIGQFSDIHELTMYPDYRVPQILQYRKVYVYSEYLRNMIHNKQQITDRHLEIQIRAGLVVVVERMKQYLKNKGLSVLSIELDWFLWQLGQNQLQILQPHHRCLTIYY